MCAKKDPLKILLKGLLIFGFYRRAISKSRRIYTAVSFLLFGILIWSLVVLSVFQSTSVDDFMDRLLLAVTSISLCFKTLLLGMKLTDLSGLLKILDEISAEQKLEKQFEIARKKSLWLMIFHFISNATALIVSLAASLYFQKLVVAIYIHESFDIGNQWIFVVLWIFVALGGCYAAYLAAILDLLPIVLMINLSSILSMMNAEMKNANLNNFEETKAKTQKCVEFQIKANG
jgi:hypothetical protein